MANKWVVGNPGYEGTVPVRLNNIPTSPQDQLRQVADRATGIRDARNQELQQLGREFETYDDTFAPLISTEIQKMIGGEYGLTPEQEKNILDLDGLSNLDASGRIDRYWNQSAKLRDASGQRLSAYEDAINPREDQDTEANVYDWLNRMDTQGFDILNANDAEVMDVLDMLKGPVRIADTRVGGAGGAGGGGGYSSYSYGGGGGPVSFSPADLSGLRFTDEFSSDYLLTPEEQADLVRLSAGTVGQRYRTSRANAIDALRRAGVTNPLAMAELERQMAEDEGRATDTGILAARVGADSEAANRLLNREGINTQLQTTKAGLAQDAARTAAQLADSAAGRSHSAAMARAADAAAAARLEAQIAAGNRTTEAQLTSGQRQFVTGALSGLGSRQVDWLDNVGKTGIGWEQSRDNEMNRRKEVLAREGYGGNVDVEGNIMAGETALRTTIADQGLDYSNARSGRFAGVADYNQDAKIGGVDRGMDFWGKNRDDRMRTYGLRAQNDALSFGTTGSAAANLGDVKNNEPEGFGETLWKTALGVGAKWATGGFG